ncbi:MAG: dTMP kinase [Acidobacteria bacterium]|nr:dTMP kinase [Acidobacteriota bacterium]
MSTTDAQGLFVTFEGGDGSGKTTQIRRLVAHLRAEGYDVLETAEPGGTPIGGQIRHILLDPANDALDPRAELLLYFASRAQNVHQWILPALNAGKVIICDRFTDSTLVYQGYGRGLGEEYVHQLHQLACGTLQPDLTIYLDIDLETALARAHARNREQTGPAQSRMDEQSVDFHRSVRDAYLDLASKEPKRIIVIDARPDPDTVEKSIWDTLAPRLEGVHVL